MQTHINRDGFNEKYPVCLIKFADGSLHLAAGYHRFAAAIGEHVKVLGGGYARDLTFENLPLASVPAETILGNMDDVIRLIQIDNFKHDAAVNADVGKALSRAEKKEQCLRLLGFPEFFGKSLRVLETEFGMPRSTIAELKKELTVRVGQCAERELSDLELLNDFGLTRARFDKMLLLIRSGARAGADGRVTKTQASAVKKESALARAAAELRLRSLRSKISSMRFAMSYLVWTALMSSADSFLIWGFRARTLRICLLMSLKKSALRFRVAS